MSTFLREAIRYARIGFAVFPILPGGKVPAIRGGHGVKDATKDLAKLAAWAQSKRLKAANIGLACGEPSGGLVVVDIDPRHGGNRSIAALALVGKTFPHGPRSRTGNGGAHLLFRWDGRLGNSKGRLGDGIDTRATGGYVVAPPSWVKPSDAGTGGHYEWIVPPWDRDGNPVPLPRLPIWLGAMLAPREPKPYTPPQTFAEGARAIDGLVRFASSAVAGHRNSSTFWAACRAAEVAADGKIAREAARQRMIIAGLTAGLPKDEVERTVDSAFGRVGKK